MNGEQRGRREVSAVVVDTPDAQSADAEVFHLRDWCGRHEIDLIIQRDDGRVFACEVKLAATASSDDARHLRWMYATEAGPIVARCNDQAGLGWCGDSW